MLGLLRDRSGKRATAAALAVAAGLAFVPAPAHAQSFFDSLLRALGGHRQAPPPQILPDPRDPRAWELRDEPQVSGPPVTFCVRLCDGRYFPLPRAAGERQVSAAKTCSAMCPASQTKVFSGGAIDHAVSQDGKRYSGLKTAFLYRDRVVDGCSCTGEGNGGLARLDPLSDPTLRPGDIVVTEEGPMAFTGKKRGDPFVPAEDYKGLPRNVRAAMAELRVARDAPAAGAMPPLTTPDPAAPPVTFSPQASLTTPSGSSAVAP